MRIYHYGPPSQEIIQLLLTGDSGVLLHLAVALDDMHVYLCEEILDEDQPSREDGTEIIRKAEIRHREPGEEPGGSHKREV